MHSWDAIIDVSETENSINKSLVAYCSGELCHVQKVSKFTVTFTVHHEHPSDVFHFGLNGTKCETSEILITDGYGW